MNISVGISEETTTAKLKFSELPKGFTENQGIHLSKQGFHECTDLESSPSSRNC